MDIKKSFVENGFYIFTEPAIELEKIQNASEGMDMLRAGVYDTRKPSAQSRWNLGDAPNHLCRIEQP